jgi:hypothetical protein
MRANKGIFAIGEAAFGADQQGRWASVYCFQKRCATAFVAEI